MVYTQQVDHQPGATLRRCDSGWHVQALEAGRVFFFRGNNKWGTTWKLWETSRKTMETSRKTMETSRKTMAQVASCDLATIRFYV